jgi:hypothetical protein
MRIALMLLALTACAPDPQGPNFHVAAPQTGSIRVEVCPRHPAGSESVSGLPSGLASPPVRPFATRAQEVLFWTCMAAWVTLALSMFVQ